MVLASKRYQGKQVQNYPAAYAAYKRNLLEALRRNKHENLTKPYGNIILSSPYKTIT